MSNNQSTSASASVASLLLGKRSKGETGGFSSITCRATFQSRFPGVTVTALDDSCPRFEVRASKILSEESLIEILQLTATDLVTTMSITRAGGEKTLYFGTFDLLRYPLAMLQDTEYKPVVSVLQDSLEGQFDSAGDISDEDEVHAASKVSHEQTLTFASSESTTKLRTQGPVEFVVNAGERIIYINEVKSFLQRTDMETCPAMWQLLGEIFTAIHMNKDTAPVFGALTSLSQWIFVKGELIGSTFRVSVSRDFHLYLSVKFGHDQRDWAGFSDACDIISFLLEILRLSLKDPPALEPQHFSHALKKTQERIRANVDAFIAGVQKSRPDLAAQEEIA